MKPAPVPSKLPSSSRHGLQAELATAFVTHTPLTAFLVGIASATGAGISMAFSEALSDLQVIDGGALVFGNA